MFRFMDQRNPAHLRAAFEFIEKHGKASYSEGTKRDLEALGIGLPPRLRMRAGEADVVICGFFDLAKGLIYGDNRLGKCPDCGRAIEWRPHSEVGKPLLCLFCAADRLQRSLAS